jgi:hypothetical protein
MTATDEQPPSNAQIPPTEMVDNAGGIGDATDAMRK